MRGSLDIKIGFFETVAIVIRIQARFMVLSPVEMNDKIIIAK